MNDLLRVEKVRKAFGGLVAVNEVTFSLERGEVLAVVGPNGSGKSTLLNVLSGVYQPDAGNVVLEGRRIDGHRPSTIARLGISRTFQSLQLFAGLTVLDNVLVGLNSRLSSTIVQALLGTPGVRSEERRARADGLVLLERVGLPDKADLYPSSLSYGQRRLLEVARALAVQPKILMLDEPVAGLAAREADALGELIRGLAASGMSVMVVEHNMRFVMELVERIVVLNFGKKIAEGVPDVIRTNPSVIAAYLGTGTDAGS